MKVQLLVLATLLASFTVSAQKSWQVNLHKIDSIVRQMEATYNVVPASKEALKPYASAGAGVGGNLNTYGVEVGLYNHSYWVAVVTEFTPDQDKTQVYMGPKFYKTLYDVSTESQLLAYAALKVHLNGTRDFAFEPGLCYVYTFDPKWALQISASSPIYEGQRLGNPVNLSGGLSINYWIR